MKRNGLFGELLSRRLLGLREMLCNLFLYLGLHSDGMVLALVGIMNYDISTFTISTERSVSVFDL